jgi:uncharacterized phage protein (TIGR01671 family)
MFDYSLFVCFVSSNNEKYISRSHEIGGHAMREIKFRAWNTHREIMYSAEEIGKDQLTLCPNNGGFVNVCGQSFANSKYYKHIIPLQYTGLKDKNGKEIYEGDVIKNVCRGRIETGYENDTAIVKFAFGKFVETYWNCGLLDVVMNCEVIGNIYENPDLLLGEDTP